MEPWRRNLIIGLLVVATLAVFGQVIGHPFISYDDPAYVTENKYVPLGLTAKGIAWSFTTGETAHWHPITWLSHMLDCQLFGVEAAGHHAINLLLHLANTLLLFAVLRAMTGAAWPSGLVAALFALHPLHVESVAWIAQRKDVLSTFWGLLSMGAYVWYARRPGVGRYLLTAMLLALGLLSKPMLVTLPLVFLLLDYWPLDRLRSIALVMEKIPLLALSAASSAITYMVMHAAGAMAEVEQVPLRLRLANAVVSYVRYLGKTVWPTKLSVLYPHPNMVGGTPWTAWQIAGAFALLAAITLLVVLLARRHRYVPVGWLWYLGMLVPGIGLVQVGEQAMADSFTYLPLVGLFIIVAWGGAEVVNRLRGSIDLCPAAVVATSVTLAALMVCTWLQLRHWRSSAALFEHALAVTGSNPTMHYALGYARQQLDQHDAALAEYNLAIEGNPRLAAAYRQRALIHDHFGRTDRALADYAKAIELAADDARAYYNRGVLHGRLGNNELAVADYTKAIEADPDYGRAYFNRALANHLLGNSDAALRDLTATIALMPDLAEAYHSRAILYFQLGQYPQAWADIGMVRNVGGRPSPQFLQQLQEASDAREEQVPTGRGIK